MANVVLRIVREEGFYALYQGSSANMIRNLVMGTTQLAVYDECKSRLRRRGWGDDFRLFGLSGFLAGCACVVVGSPLDVIRSRKMVVGCSLTQHGARFSLAELIRDVYLERGMRGYYRGFVMLLLRMCSFNMVLFHTVESVKNKL